MIKENPPHSLTIFSYGMCNLNCNYCIIDKNKYLKEVDDILKESFENYEEEYVPRIKKWFPENSLYNVQTWGGEPLWDIERIFPLLDYLIKEYSSFNEFFSSTNFSYNHWVDEVKKLIDFFGSHKNRSFQIELQLSIDGPTYINDYNRGKGVTKRCIDNINKLCEYLKDNPIPSNVIIYAHIKPTLNMYNIEHQLVTKEKIIEYFQFLEDNIYEPLVNLNYQNLVFAYANPNLASPSPVTKSFGEKFANFCKMCVELEQDIRKYFKYYEIITPFRQVSKDADLLVNHLPNNFDCFLSGCTSGTNQIFMMPKGYYVTCHGAFGDIVDGYKKSMLKEETYNKKSIGFESYLMNTKSPLLLNEKQYERFSQQQEITFDEKNPSRGCFLSSVITMLALSGQIDKKYLIDSERINAMKYVGLLSVYCIYNNQVLNGSTCLGTADDIKLFLNGALDYIIWR